MDSDKNVRIRRCSAYNAWRLNINTLPSVWLACTVCMPHETRILNHLHQLMKTSYEDFHSECCLSLFFWGSSSLSSFPTNCNTPLYMQYVVHTMRWMARVRRSYTRMYDCAQIRLVPDSPRANFSIARPGGWPDKRRDAMMLVCVWYCIRAIWFACLLRISMHIATDKSSGRIRCCAKVHDEIRRDDGRCLDCLRRRLDDAAWLPISMSRSRVLGDIWPLSRATHRRWSHCFFSLLCEDASFG